MFCPKCGSQVADGAAFCPNCGNQMSQKAAPSQSQVPTQQTFQQQFPATNVQQQGTAAAPAQGNNNGKLILIGVGVAAVVALVAVLALCRNVFGGSRFYKVGSFLSASASTQLKELEDTQELDYEEGWGCYWTGDPQKAPYDDEVTVYLGDEDGDTITREDLEDDKAARSISINWSCELDADDMEDALDQIEGDLGLSKRVDVATDDDWGYGASWGKCTIDGEDGVWLMRVYADGDEYSISLYGITLEGLGYDSYDELSADFQESE